MSKFNLIESDCSESCRFKIHGDLITSSITRSNVPEFKLACYILNVCKNYAHVLDSERRNALHMAASCGRKDLCIWLMKIGKSDINLKDYESGYTPLHRSIFYGHINIAVELIKNGAQLNILDRDELTASEHGMKDRLIKDFSPNNPCQVYVWGANNNYTLGTGSQKSLKTPELLDVFRKHNLSIKQVVTDKFHTVFVSTSGQAWTCGHGQGGRLGLVKEQTVLTPRQIKTPNVSIALASIARDHTLLLADNGTVWSCGNNTHHVLGHVPPPLELCSPQPISSRLLKSGWGTIVNVAAARYHSVLWSNDSVLTFGLNAGQLGHPMLQEKYITSPKLVLGLNLSGNGKIVDVASSIGATVVATSKGDIYLLYNYQTKRIPVASKSHKNADKILNVVKVAVVGGTLNAEVDGKLSAKGGEELRVIVLTSTGDLLLWSEMFPQLTRVIHSLKRSFYFSDISLSSTKLLLFTKDGETFVGHLKLKPKKKSATNTTPQSPKSERQELNSKDEGVSFNQFLDRMDCHHITLTRVPHTHRAVGLAMDPIGQNFFVIQENPKVNLTDIPLIEPSELHPQLADLLRDSHEDDTLHDVLFVLDKCRVPAHHFVLAQASEEFANMARTGSCIDYRLKGVDRVVLDLILCFVYTNNCSIISTGPLDPLLINFKGDIVKATLELARRLKITLLIKCLLKLRYEDGIILLKTSEGPSILEMLRTKPLFSRSMSPGLYDISISSNDGAAFKAHKCILAARLEYFNSMFTGGWVEADATSSLSLPVPQVILKEVLDILYSDEAPLLMESQDVDYVSSVLVVADQLFIARLKQVCEVALCGCLNLRNAAYILQLAITYNANQLKNSCMQFISLNLSSILESRILEVLDDKALEDLSKYYRNMLLSVEKRLITPYTLTLTDDEISQIADANPVQWLSSTDDLGENEQLNSNRLSSATKKKKPARNRNSSESHRKRNETVSSNSDLDISFDMTSDEKIDFEELEEIKTTPTKVDSWVTVDKHQKTVQNRLKAILTASKIEPTAENFTPLTSTRQTSSNVTIQDSEHFPSLENQHSYSSPPKTCFVELKHVSTVKMSQKQRKKLLSEKSKEVEVEEKLPWSPPRSAWAPIPALDSSFDSLMSNSPTINSPPTSELSKMKFSDIMADEIQQRDNWSKMKSKPLQLTQIEERAIEELRVFYNAANMFDERISVQRVLSVNVAKPMWIKSHHL